MSLDTNLKPLTPFTRINTKWIICLNIKHKTIKILEDNIGENSGEIGFGNEFLNIMPKTRYIKEKNNKLDFIKTKIFCFGKATVKRMKRKSTDCDNTLSKHITNKTQI